MQPLSKQRVRLGHYIGFAVFALFIAGNAEAQSFPERYQSLVALPQLNARGGGLADYFNQLYMIAVAIGAILAFIKISIAGVKWSLSEIITDKSQAREDIKGALLGLAILLIPFIVLNTIYSGLTNLNILENSAIRIRPPSSVAGPPANQPAPITVTPDTPTEPPPNMQCAGVDYLACASATDCSAARTQCNNYQTRCQSPQQTVNTNITSSVPMGATMIVCTYRTNINPVP